MKGFNSIVVVLCLFLLLSCNRAKKVINKTGETVGQGATEFVHGAANGIDETLECSIQLSQALTGNGLQYGKYYISSGKNVLTAYLIFNKGLKQDITVKVFDEKGQEYGRTRAAIEGKKGEAKYYDFTFDNRTVLESKSKFDFE